MLLYILVGTSLLGAAVIWAFRIETAGINLELSRPQSPSWLNLHPFRLAGWGEG